MFIQPDWFDPRAPGVGTNRYTYSHNDPVNRLDPSGNVAVYSDSDGDGENETSTYFSPTTEIGADLAAGDYSSYYSWKGEWGGLRSGFASEGYRDVSWTGGGFSFPGASGDISLSFGAQDDPYHSARSLEVGLVALGAGARESR